MPPRLRVIVGFILMMPTYAWSCHEYLAVAPAELKEARDILVSKESDPLDRLFAFQMMSCSDQPSVRSYAINVASTHTDDVGLRHAYLLSVFMQKDVFSVILTPPENANDRAKAFFEKTGGALNDKATSREFNKGCVSLENGDRCTQNRSARISGDVIEIAHEHVVARFQYSENGQMIGFVARDYRGGTGTIPAKLLLF